MTGFAQTLRHLSALEVGRASHSRDRVRRFSEVRGLSLAQSTNMLKGSGPASLPLRMGPASTASCKP